MLRLAYDGSPFHGWQLQPGGVPTVQAAVEDALGKLLRQPTPVVGAGRTDAGVNAACMYAHFDTDAEVDLAGLPRRINAIVGSSVVVYEAFEVSPNLHARFSAVSRTYHYYAALTRSPFDYKFTWPAPPRLDFEAMNRAARLLLDTDDFTSFAKLHTDVKTNICHVTQAEWVRVDDRKMVFVITADRFLRNMVRAVVGTLVEVGRGKIGLDGFREIIEKRNRCAAGNSMPAQALFLQNVDYPAGFRDFAK